MIFCNLNPVHYRFYPLLIMRRLLESPRCFHPASARRCLRRAHNTRHLEDLQHGAQRTTRSTVHSTARSSSKRTAHQRTTRSAQPHRAQRMEPRLQRTAPNRTGRRTDTQHTATQLYSAQRTAHSVLWFCLHVFIFLNYFYLLFFLLDS
jgi:hypothetical protein